MHTIVKLSALVIALAVAAPAAAQKEYALVEGTVIDEEERPVRGVAVTVTAPGRPDFLRELTTNRKGEFEVKIEGEAGAHLFGFEKEGFEPYEAKLELELGMAQSVTFRLVREGANDAFKANVAYNHGLEAYKAGDRESARTDLLQALELNPELPQPRLLLADIYLGEERYQEAAAEIEQYLATQPEDPWGHGIAFQAYRALGDAAGQQRSKEALAGSEVATQLATQIYNEGVKASREGKVEEALSAFETALEVAPDLAAVYSGMAAVLYNDRRHDDALVAVSKFLAAQPDDPQGRRLRYLILESKGDPAAVEALAAYGEVAPEGATSVLYEQAETQFREGRVEAARDTLFRVLEISPDMPRAHYTLGLCFASLGDLPKAKEHLKRFIELAPEDPEAAAAKEMLAAL